MPQRHETGFVTTCNADYLTTQPGASAETYTSDRWKSFEAVLIAIEGRAAAAESILAVAAANSGGQLISYQNLVPLNEAASDLGYIHDKLEATVSHLGNETMAAWQKRAVSSKLRVDALLATAKQSGHTLSLHNPTFDFAQLR